MTLPLTGLSLQLSIKKACIKYLVCSLVQPAVCSKMTILNKDRLNLLLVQPVSPSKDHGQQLER